MRTPISIAQVKQALAMAADEQALVTTAEAPNEVKIERPGEKAEIVNLEQAAAEESAASEGARP